MSGVAACHAAEWTQQRRMTPGGCRYANSNSRQDRVLVEPQAFRSWKTNQLLHIDGPILENQIDN